MKFSPVAVAVSVVAGVIFTYYFGIIVSMLFAAAFLLIFIVRIIICRELDFVIIALAVAYAVGIGSYMICSMSHDLLSYTSRYVTVTGFIQTEARESGTNDNYRYVMRVQSIDKNGEIKDMNDSLLLTTPSKFKCGDRVIVKGIVRQLQSQMNENGFNTAMYYKSQNIYARMYTKETESTGVSEERSPYIVCGRFRETVDDIIYRFYSGDTAALLSAVVTGNMNHFSDEYKLLLNRTAFKRMLHPAYLHILLISWLVGLFIHIIPRKCRDFVMAVLVIGFALCSSAQIGFVRCLAMFVVMMFLRYKNGGVHYPDAMAWIIVACAIVSPMLLFNVSFILSCTAGMVIWAFTPFIENRLGFMPRYFARTLSVMIVCTFIYTPITLKWFNGICVYSLIAPVIMGPVVLLILFLAPFVLGLLSVFGTAPILGGYMNFLIWFTLRMPVWISKLPFSRIILKTPSDVDMLIIICLIFALYYFLKPKPQKAKIFTLSACALCVSVIINMVFDIGTVAFTFVNVGQGDGAVIHTAFGGTVIVDGGGGNNFSQYNPGESLFVPYLESKGYDKISAAFVSHFHQDHVQGVIAAIEQLNVKAVFAPAPEEDWDKTMLDWKAKLETAAKERGTEVHYISHDTKISFENGLMVHIYAPDEVIKFSDDGNDTSMLMKFSYGDCDVLYTGDMNSYCEHEYLNIGVPVDAEILKVSHHGSRGSTDYDWVKSVNPKLAVISCGENNSYGHPHKETLERLSGITTMSTAQYGDITVTVDKDKLRSIRVLR